MTRDLARENAALRARVEELEEQLRVLTKPARADVMALRAVGVRLLPQEMRVFAYLRRLPAGALVSHDQLAAVIGEARGDAIPSRVHVSVVVGQVRKKLRLMGYRIENARGEGYAMLVEGSGA